MPRRFTLTLTLSLKGEGIKWMDTTSGFKTFPRTQARCWDAELNPRNSALFLRFHSAARLLVPLIFGGGAGPIVKDPADLGRKMF
jgi:hypothetical protein